MPTPYDDCLNEAIIEGVIDEKHRDRFAKAFEKAKKEAEAKGLPVGSDTEFAGKAIKRMMAEVGKSKVDVARSIMKTDAIIDSVMAHKTVKLPAWLAKVVGDANPIYRGLETLFGERLRGEGAYLSITREREAARGILYATASDLLEKLRTKNLGLNRDRVAPKDMMKAHFGEQTDVPGATEHAGAYGKLKALALDMLEEQGVKVNRLEKHAPQDFNSGKVQDMGKDNFVSSMMADWKAGTYKLRDWSVKDKVVYFQPGKDDARVAELLGGTDKKPGMFKNITTNGNASIEVGVRKGETMTDRYNKRRVIEWANADAYFHFLDKYGHGSENLGELLIREINNLADDIGTARTLGNDASRTVDTVMQWAKREGNMSEGQIHALEKTWFHASGEANQPANVTLANAAKTTRLWLTAVQLSNAMLGSAPDFAFVKSVSGFNGLNTFRMMGDYFSRSEVSVRKARQQGLIIQADRGYLHDHAGEQFTLTGPARIAGHAAEFVMKGTGLDSHTMRIRTMAGREFLATMADIAEHSWTDLPVLNRRFLERYGIDAKDWDLLRTHGMEGERLFMNPLLMAEMPGAPRTAAMKLLGAVDAESGIAVNEASVATRAMWLGTTRAGTWSGEALRSVQYKGFATSAMLKSGWRMVDSMFDTSGTSPRGRYIAALAIEATVLGAFSYQLKNLAVGKDLEAMDTAAFWAKAAAQGGAGGLLGDYVKTMVNTRTMDDVGRMISPTAGLVYDATMLTTGNAAQWWEGEKTNLGREATRFGKKYLFPRLWQTNLAVDRLGWDTLQRAADQDAPRAFHRLERKLYEQTGQHYFAPPGGGFEGVRVPEMAGHAPPKASR